MYYGEIKNCDIANGLGVRITLFVSGCTHHCKDCFQPETWRYDYGQEFTGETEEKILEMLKPDYVDGLTLLGGEPMDPDNQRVLLPFLRRAKQMYPKKNIWCYTGYRFEEDLLGRFLMSSYMDGKPVASSELEDAESVPCVQNIVNAAERSAHEVHLKTARCAVTDELLSYIDVLVDGEFIAAKKNISLAFRGSENQRLINVPLSLKEGMVITIDLDRKMQ